MKIRHHQDGTVSLTHLTRAELRDVEHALSALVTEHNVSVHQPAPFWWTNDGLIAENHVEWFEQRRDEVKALWAPINEIIYPSRGLNNG